MVKYIICININNIYIWHGTPPKDLAVLFFPKDVSKGVS